MPRPKKTAEPKVPAPVAAAPPQPMIPAAVPPQAIPQGMPPGMPQTVPMPQQFQQFHHQLPPLPMGAPPAPGLSNESFTRVRDAAVGRLTMILDLLRSFTADYIRQTNMLLGEPTPDVSPAELLANFEHSAPPMPLPVHPDMVPAVEEKKERKKRTHDPNAPKRPLTPYFLYMQHARSIIANDLGSEAPKGAVQEEGQRRWASMTAHEKQGWNNAYQYNLRLYNARVHSYKAGNLLAKSMTDEEALKYADENGVALPELKDASAAADAAPNDQDAIAAQLQQVAAAPAPEVGDETETKTPKKGGAGRKRKSEPAPAEAATPASPDKKRRRSGKPAETVEEPKKSGRKKTKSS